MNEYRCTRNAPYSNPRCPGYADTSARQGHYVWAEDVVEAITHMETDFPQDGNEGFSIRLNKENVGYHKTHTPEDAEHDGFNH